MAGRAEWQIDAAFEKFLDEATEIRLHNYLTDEQIVKIVDTRVGSDAADALSNWLMEDTDR